MKIYLKTVVEGDYKTVAARFDLQLFEYLVPPFTKVKIETYSYAPFLSKGAKNCPK